MVAPDGGPMVVLPVGGPWWTLLVPPWCPLVGLGGPAGGPCWWSYVVVADSGTWLLQLVVAMYIGYRVSKQ